MPDGRSLTSVLSLDIGADADLSLSIAAVTGRPGRVYAPPTLGELEIPGFSARVARARRR